MEHPVGGAFANSEEHLLDKFSVLEKALEGCLHVMEYQNEKLEFAESAVDYFQKKSMKKDKEIQHLEKEIGRLRRLKGESEEKKATCKPMGKGRKSVCIRPGRTARMCFA